MSENRSGMAPFTTSGAFDSCKLQPVISQFLLVCKWHDLPRLNLEEPGF
jgi:hypothetical protein